MTIERFRLHLKKLANEAGSQKALAKKLHVTEAYLSAVIKGKFVPSNKLLATLGLESVVDIRKIK